MDVLLLPVAAAKPKGTFDLKATNWQANIHIQDFLGDSRIYGPITVPLPCLTAGMIPPLLSWFNFTPHMMVFFQYTEYFPILKFYSLFIIV